MSLQTAFAWGEPLPGAVLNMSGGLAWWRGLPREVRAVCGRASHSPAVILRREGRGVVLVGPVSLVSLKCCATAWLRWSHRGRASWAWQPEQKTGKGLNDGR